MSHEKVFIKIFVFQKFFIRYPYLNASIKTIIKQNHKLADLMHSPITMSDHSARPSLRLDTTCSQTTSSHYYIDTNRILLFCSQVWAKYDCCNQVFVIKVDFCSDKPKMNFRPNKHKYYRHYKSLLELYE